MPSTSDETSGQGKSPSDAPHDPPPNADAILGPELEETPEMRSQASEPQAKAVSKRFRVSDKLLLVSTGVGSNVLRLGTTLVLARVVDKTDFGLYGLVLAAPGLVAGFGDLGAHIIVTQVRDIDRREVDDTATAMIVVLGSIQSVIFLVGGIIIADKTGDPRALPVALIIAATTFLAMFYRMQLNKLNRDFRFKRESLQNLIFSVTSCVTAIVFALLGFGVFALAGQLLASQLLANTFAIQRSDVRWPGAASWRTFKRSVRLTWSIYLSDYFTSLEGKCYELVSARVGGLTNLADWRQATNGLMILTQSINPAVDRVVLPKLCASVSEPERFAQLFRYGTELTWLANIGLCAWLYINAADVVAIFLGAKWAPVAPVLSILALSIPAFSSTAYQAALAAGRTQIMLFWSIPRAIIMVGALFLLLHLGFDPVLSVAWVATAARLIFGAAFFATVVVLLRIPVARLLGSMATITACGAVSAVTMHFVAAEVPTWGPFLRILLVSGAGVVAFLTPVALFSRSTLKTVWSVCFDR